MNKKLNLSRETVFVAYMAASIDGRIAKSGQSGADWTSIEDWHFLQKSLSKFDAVIVGHNTYKLAQARLKKRNTIVLTSKAEKINLFGLVIFFNPKKNNLKKFLQAKNYKKIAVLGGPRVYDFCLRNKMLDELFVTIEPYVFTTGVSMFAGNEFKKHKFILQSMKKFNTKGTILLHYKYAN